MKKLIIWALVIVLIGLVACTPMAQCNTIKATGMTLKAEITQCYPPDQFLLIKVKRDQINAVAFFASLHEFAMPQCSQICL